MEQCWLLLQGTRSPAPVDESAVKAMAGELRALLKEKKCHPLVIRCAANLTGRQVGSSRRLTCSVLLCRMAWHDSGTYDQVRCCLHCPAGGQSAVGRGQHSTSAAPLLPSAKVQMLLLGT